MRELWGAKAFGDSLIKVPEFIELAESFVLVGSTSWVKSCGGTFAFSQELSDASGSPTYSKTDGLDKFGR